jgi:hypothetical protein
MGLPATSNSPIGHIFLGAVDFSNFEAPLVPDTLYQPDTLGHYYLLVPYLTPVNEKKTNLPIPIAMYCLFD